MFEKTLQDLVKGIRANKRDPGAFISQAIAEIKVELKNVDPFIKVSSSSSQELCSRALLHF
jgi:AP-3 complex subunit delta